MPRILKKDGARLSEAKKALTRSGRAAEETACAPPPFTSATERRKGHLSRQRRRQGHAVLETWPLHALTPTLPAPVGPRNHGPTWSFVDMQLEDIRARVVAHDIEVELAARDVAQVQVRVENSRFAQQRTRN